MSWDKKVLDHIRKTKSGHYNIRGIEPLIFIESWDMPFLEGCVVKYVCRNLARRDGVFSPPQESDILKATHYLRQIWERDYGSKPSKVPGVQSIGSHEEGHVNTASPGGGTVDCCIDVSRSESGLGREQVVEAICGNCREAVRSDTSRFSVGPGGTLCHKCSKVSHGGE